LDDIVVFAEVDEFIDTAVQTVLVRDTLRLGFFVAAHLQENVPEVLNGEAAAAPPLHVKRS
jgi:ABC-type polysaccharide/polyol phosphate transport system ATPase subunit